MSRVEPHDWPIHGQFVTKGMTEQRPDKLHHPGKIKRKSECVCVCWGRREEKEREREKRRAGGEVNGSNLHVF